MKCKTTTQSSPAFAKADVRAILEGEAIQKSVEILDFFGTKFLAIITLAKAGIQE
jgi:hypothetical protein